MYFILYKEKHISSIVHSNKIQQDVIFTDINMSKL